MTLDTILNYIINGGFLAILAFIVFFKARKKVENLNASAKDVEVSKSALEGLNTVTQQLNTAYEKIGKMGRRIDELKEITAQRAKHVAVLNIKLIHFAEILERQMDLKDFAEMHIDLNVESKDRVPPLGTYKSISDREAVREILTDMKKYEIEYGIVQIKDVGKNEDK